MDIGTLLSVVQTLLAALSCSELKEAWTLWDYKSNLDELTSVVGTIKKVLLDAEAKYDQLSQETLQYIEELSNALYDADDLLDEFATLAKQKLIMEEGKFTEKVRLFVSRYNQVGVAYSMSQGVKKIMTKLDGIASRHSKFGLSLDHNPMRRRREETCSYTDTEIIGRDADVEKIVGMLLDSDVQRDVSFLTIVGMGGLGKTALAQLVYNHEKIKREFSLRLWTCVSDHDQSNLDVKSILAQILESASGKKLDVCSMEVVVNRLREILLGKRFLIVLDDLWTESRDELRKLIGHLVGGKGGSQIVVTTRSKETAKIVGNGRTYELKGLTDKDSWRLFKMMAFEQMLDQASTNGQDDFVIIGKEIVKICANVPLAIRVIGSLLYKQDKSKWLSVQQMGLANLSAGQNRIKPILKLSYHNLDSPLKSCFSYCSLYPKDFKIDKEELLRLWIAQGYVVPRGNGQSVEDLSEEYFLVLLHRCFFQDVVKSDFGEILSFKLHDLMHDVALEVSEKEICPASSYTRDVDKLVRHVSFRNEQYANNGLTKTHIRTYLHLDSNRFGLDFDTTLPLARLANYRCLRTLDLSYLGIKTLPSSIGKLIHLRYLNLSMNYMEVLPNSITKLYNLQTLYLDQCGRLKELPKDFSKLVNLGVIGLQYCSSLTFMPSGMSKLTNLHSLSMFVVGMVQSTESSLKQHIELEGLRALKKLRGHIVIKIHFPKRGAFVKDNTVRDGGYIRDKEHLNSIRVECKHEKSNEGVTDYEEELLGALQPHGNLKELTLNGYQGVRMPRWAIEDNMASFLPKIVQLVLCCCQELEHLPSLGKLQSLKILTLEDLPKLEYIETYSETISIQCGSSGEGLRFFPSLEKLKLFRLPKLKEWWGRSGERVGGGNSITRSHEPHQLSLFLPQLISLDIFDCPNLASLLCCPNVKNLYFLKFDQRLRLISNRKIIPKLTEVRTDNMSWLHASLPMESFQSLTSLELYKDSDVESLDDFGEVFRACSASLRILKIWDCTKLRSVSGGLGYLTALEELHLQRIPIVNLADEEIEEDNGMPWGSLCHTLHFMNIYGCEELQSLPKWMRKLTSLQQLNIVFCSKRLNERCQNPDGEDWPNIQHIPEINIWQ